MRIALVTHYFQSHGGGVEIVAGRLARELGARAGFQTAWYASDCDALPAPEPMLEAVPMHAANTVERTTGLPFPFWSPAALSQLAQGIRRADLVHLHDFAYPSSLAAVRIARRAGIPIVITQHTGAVRPASRAAGWFYRVLESAFARRSFEAANAVAFVSETTRAHCEQRFGPLGNASTVWNGVDAVPWQPPPERSAGSAPTVLFVGRLVRKKGIEIVRRIAAAMPEFRFVLAGRGPSDPAHWGLANVHAVGHLDAQQLRHLYLAADVLLLPSYFEGFPLVVQEALVNGLAVLTTDEVGAACPPAAPLLSTCPLPCGEGDAQPWIDALRALAANLDGNAEREQRAARAAALWSWARCAEDYAALMRAATHR